MFLDEIGGVADDLCIKNRFAFRVIERRNRHAPSALAADAPVGTGFNCSRNSIFSPVRNPVYFCCNRINCSPPKSPKSFSQNFRGWIFRLIWKLWMFSSYKFRDFMIYFDEPLIHRTEDNGRLAAPAMWVAVMIIFLMEQCVTHAQLVKHNFICLALAMLFQNGFANHFFWHLLFNRQIIRVSKTAVIIHRRVNWQAVLAAKIVVVLAVAGGAMDETRAGVGGNEVGRKRFAKTITKRVLIFQSRKFTS